MRRKDKTGCEAGFENLKEDNLLPGKYQIKHNWNAW